MIRRIEKDAVRFRQIVRGKIKEDLRRYITQGELIGKQGKQIVSIPLPQIEIPRFKYGSNRKAGVGQGEGAEGTPIDAGSGEGSGVGGDAPGSHILEVEVTLEELAQILGEELELPRIEAKGSANIQGRRQRYTGIRTTGPESLRHLKRTFRRALKRQIAAGIYDPERPVIIPIREDKRYLSWKNKLLPENRAVVIYMMDVSGSMGTEQKEIVRITAFWIDTWLRSQYKNLEVRYIVHDAVAHEVDSHTFYHLRESGGTKISSAYELCARLIDEQFSPEDWNIYPFHFSDGDNWSGKDTERCVDLLRERLFSRVNQFSYGQVKSAYGSGQFKGDLEKACGEEERLVAAEIPSRDGIPDCIKAFLGRGR